MHQQPEKCKDNLDQPRTRKFTARQQIIDEHMKDMQRRCAEYEDAIARISKLREQAIAAVGRDEAAITRAKAQVQELARKIVEAKNAGNQDALTKSKTAAWLLEEVQEIVVKALARRLPSRGPAARACVGLEGSCCEPAPEKVRSAKAGSRRRRPSPFQPPTPPEPAHSRFLPAAAVKRPCTCATRPSAACRRRHRA